ncbi:MAG TPA: CNNM domain-containing protein [Usitatibacter sp.]|nr:CNNM domain-containing protein [Usitatibacter sp.]
MTDDFPLWWLFAALAVLLAASGFFSMSETCMMALNRYRLRHRVREGNRGARLATKLLERTDELLAFILAGNTALNASVTILVTEICRRLFGEGELVLGIATISASFTILILAEILPKILGATYSETIALGASYVITPLIHATRPAMLIVNVFVKAILKVLRIRQVGEQAAQPLSMEELRTLVLEGGKFIPKKHQSIFLNLFELEDMTIDDTMTPRGQIEALNLLDDIDEIRSALATAHHTRLVVTEGGLDNVIGILHVRKVVNAMREEQVDVEGLRKIMREPYYVPEGTALLTQLSNFQENQRHLGLVVDEYGEILGLVTMKDILEEIVGEFTSQAYGGSSALFHKEPDGSVIADGACSLRVLNRKAGFAFPLDGPKTINGLLLEQLEDIPEAGTAIMVADHPVEILQVQNRMVKVVKILPTPVAPRAEEKAAA